MSKAGKQNGRATAEAIDRILPQTQCTRCGYAGCKPYAEAIAAGEADINRCPPGGQTGIVKLARLLGREPRPLDPGCGVEKPLAVAVIDEPNCIGCTLCIQACPVDAIVGAPKLMHTVIRDLCTGCELCLPPCPVDCILMVQPPVPVEWTPQRADAARHRFESRKARLEREQAERTERLAQRAAAARAAPDAAAKRAIIEAAMQRARAARSGNEKPAVEEGCSPDGRKA